jgi:hypothetical protein
LARLRHLVHLQCLLFQGYGRLDFVRNLPRLATLAVADAAGYDLPALAGTGLEQLALIGPPQRASVDLAPLADVRGLTSIEARIATHGWPALAGLPRLEDLQLSWIDDADRLTELVSLTGLRSLSLNHVFRLIDLAPLEFLAEPVSLSFDGCKALEDVTLLGRWSASLQRLRLIACPPVDPAPIAELTDLRVLDLTATHLPDLSLLSGLRRLRDLRVRDLHRIPDLTPLSGLDQLESLTVTGMGQLDLRPFAGRSRLRVQVGDLIEPVGAELLGPGSAVVVTNSAEVDSTP